MHINFINNKTAYVNQIEFQYFDFFTKKNLKGQIWIRSNV
jgi:hypothetical protein